MPKYSLIFRTGWYEESCMLLQPLTKASCNMSGTVLGHSELPLVLSTATKAHTKTFIQYANT